MFRNFSSVFTLYTLDSRLLLPGGCTSQITCRLGVQAGHWVRTCACSQHTNVTDITSVLDDAVRRGSTRGVIFLPIFFRPEAISSNMSSNVSSNIRQCSSCSFSRDFEKAIIAQKSLVLSLGPAGCLEATDRQHVRFRQGERCERRLRTNRSKRSGPC